MNIQLPPDFWFIVAIILGGVFLVVLSFFAEAHATGGWASFAKRYPAPARPTGKAYSVQGWRICNVNDYGNFLRVIFTDAGIYFYMTLPRRVAHPPFLLPWESVKRIESARTFYVLDIAGSIRLDLSAKVKYDLERYQKRPNI
jgi:hypothetical protein